MTNPAGFIRGSLYLAIEGGDQLDLGSVSLPITARIVPGGAGEVAVGLDVDLAGVCRAVAAIFDSTPATEAADHE